MQIVGESGVPFIYTMLAKICLQATNIVLANIAFSYIICVQIPCVL